MSGIKLVYFNLMGRAETARLILAQAGVSYEDKRIEKEEWPALKASLPMGQLPVLEVDGKTIGQSMAIARYCARRFGLAGKDELEGAMADPLFPNGSPLGDPGPHGDLFGDLGPLWVPFLCFGSPFLYFRLKNAK